MCHNELRFSLALRLHRSTTRHVVTQNDEEEERQRKERVLHTRVPAVLEQELKRLAKNLRVPVSNVVRTILEDAMETVDVVGKKAEGEIRHVAERVARERDRFKARRAKSDVPPPDAEDGAPAATTPPLAGIVGFQSLLLARDESCSLCGREIARGSEAYLGVRDVRGPRIVLGRECLPFAAETDKETT